MLFPFARAAGGRVGTDVVVVRPAASPHKALHGAEVLFADEVAETTHKRHLGEKRQEYGAAGIPAYWVVDSVAHVTHCFRLDETGKAHGPAEVVPFGEAMEVPGLSGAITID